MDLERFSTDELRMIRFTLSSVSKNRIEYDIAKIDSILLERFENDNKFNSDEERFERFKSEIHSFLSNNGLSHNNKVLTELATDLLPTQIARYYRMEVNEIITCLKELRSEGLIDILN